ncbi:hypothetical protein D9C73_013231 [Collichthys lucidus]|uniref:Uncharacterized protein n=1 Tax=Collichthys lucidus TaxID=240159 RepID=A0A4U5US41_COLLU|nr:hypothetical protein D9C73_013231 [Collichthys lucidus]
MHREKEEEREGGMEEEAEGDLPPLLLKLLSCKIEWTAGRIKNETWHRGRTNLEEGHCCWLHLKRWRQNVSHIGLRKVKMSGEERPKAERKASCELSHKNENSINSGKMRTEEEKEEEEEEEEEV